MRSLPMEDGHSDSLSLSLLSFRHSEHSNSFMALELKSYTEHTFEHLAYVGAPVTLGPSGQSPTGPLVHPSFSLSFVTHNKLRAPGLRNKVSDRPKLDVGHVV